MTNDAATQAPPAEEFGFEADVAQLLELMTHSVYSEREVFLRELISNAADACEKLRYESLSDEKLAPFASAPLVTITIDKDKRQLTIADNGVGMSREELISALGAIAKNKTKDIPQRFAMLEETRVTMLARATRARDYLDWFEITRAREASGEFDDYLRVKEQLKTVGGHANDPVSRYLDDMQKAFGR